MMYDGSEKGKKYSVNRAERTNKNHNTCTICIHTVLYSHISFLLNSHKIIIICICFFPCLPSHFCFSLTRKLNKIFSALLKVRLAYGY